MHRLDIAASESSRPVRISVAVKLLNGFADSPVKQDDERVDAESRTDRHTISEMNAITSAIFAQSVASFRSAHAALDSDSSATTVCRRRMTIENRSVAFRNGAYLSMSASCGTISAKAGSIARVNTTVHEAISSGSGSYRCRISRTTTQSRRPQPFCGIRAEFTAVRQT